MGKNQDLRIVFFGTPEFGAIILEKLIEAGINPILIVSAPDKPVGRKQIRTPPPVKLTAEKYSFQVVQPERVENWKLSLDSARDPDLIVVAAYGQIMPKEVLDIPKFGALNVHPSLLPKYRGPSPIQTTILNGDQEAGVTIISMDDKIDHGPIIASEKIKMKNEKTTYLELHNALAQLGGELLMQTVPRWIAGELKPQAQDHSKATYTKKITKEDGRIDWTKPAAYIERQVRAFTPWPGTYAQFKIKNEKTKMMKIRKASVLRKANEGGRKSLGKTFLIQDGNIAVQTGKEALIIEELQLEGGKPMPSKEFLLGHKNFLNTILS